MEACEVPSALSAVGSTASVDLLEEGAPGENVTAIDPKEARRLGGEKEIFLGSALVEVRTKVACPEPSVTVGRDQVFSVPVAFRT